MSNRLAHHHQHHQQQQQKLYNDTNTDRTHIGTTSTLLNKPITRLSYNTPFISQSHENVDLNFNKNIKLNDFDDDDNKIKNENKLVGNDNHEEKQQRTRIVDKTYLLKLKEKRQRLTRDKVPTTANVSGTKFEIVKLAIEAMGIRIADNDNFDCNLIWDDTRISIEGVSDLRPYQRYNHFPAMSEISRKDALARNISKLYKLLPKDFGFIPQTWILPNDYTALCAYAADQKKLHHKKTFILKPSNSACGHGIKLYKTVEKIQANDNYIVQEYIANPYLLDGFKFDLRIYVLVTSCDPLRAFIFNDGLVRLGTEQYQEPSESNIDHLYMHLTNYSLNKHNVDKYDEGDRTGQNGTKRTLKHFFEHLRKNDRDVTKLWREIQEVVLKTLLVAEPYLFHTYKMCRPGQTQYSDSVCFEILGFDILLDENLKPWLLEVNRSPSFGSDHQVDFDVKSRLLLDSFNLIRFRSSDRRRSIALEKSEAQRRLYNSEMYSNRNEINGFYQNSNSDKNVKMKQKKLFELLEQLKLLKRAKLREDYENINLGNFSRLFPIDDRSRMEDYLNILNHAFNLFYPVGKQCSWKKTYERIREDDIVDKIIEFDDENSSLTKPLNLNSEENIYKYLSQAEVSDYSDFSDADMNNSDSENEIKISKDEPNRYQNHHHKIPIITKVEQPPPKPIREPPKRTPELLSARNSDSTSRSSMSDQSNLNKKTLYNSEKRLKKDENKENTTNSSEISTKYAINLKRKAIINQSLLIDKSIKINTKLQVSRFNSHDSKIRNTQIVTERSASSLERNLYEKTMPNLRSSQNFDSSLSKLTQDKTENRVIEHIQQLSSASFLVKRDMSTENPDYEDIYNEKLAMAVYKMLVQLEIKFPGKTAQQARNFLNDVYSKFEEHKQNVGNYWMVKLDDTKRSKIIEIVKSNLVVILKRAYMTDSLDNLRLYKIFVKLLNRMLWMHGQGLWNAFQNTNKSSWETIFSKSSFIISETELKCCHRIIDLCKDCVLIVYQYALEQKLAMTNSATVKSTKSFASKSTVSILSKDDNGSNILKRKQNKK